MAHFGAISSITLPPILTPTLDHCMPMQLTPPPMGPVACLQHLQPSPVTMIPGVLSISGASSMASHSPPIIAPLHVTEKTQPMKAPKGAAERGGGSGDDAVTLFPRRKAGQGKPGGGRGPVVLTLELLEQFYGMPLHVAARRLVRPDSSPLPSNIAHLPGPLRCDY